MDKAPSTEQAIAKAYVDYDRQQAISNFKIACVLGMVLMPAGYILDRFKYPNDAITFLELRFLSSALIGCFLAVLLTPFGKRHYRAQGVTLFLIPASFIALMIYLTEGAGSPYYAGLNLVLLVLAFVLHWTFRESLVAAIFVIALYLAACVAHGRIFDSRDLTGEFVNNLYFLGLTGLIVVTGSYFHSKSRFREFALRYELNENRQILEATNQKLKELDEAKSRFFANISHELRTPLTLLIAPLESLLHRHKGALDAEARGLLLTMQSNGMRLLKLINDLLDLVRLESGVIEARPEPVDLSDFIPGLASAARQVADDKRIALETWVDPELGLVMIDRDKTEKIILNLQFNALKFTPAGGRVEIRAEKQGEELVILVKDTGMGISTKNLSNIFSRFWQADDSSRRKYQGVGIGLALVKEFTELQGGKAAVDSVEGKGTTFTVRLPYVKATAPVASASVTRRSENSVPGNQEAGVAESKTAESDATVSSQEWLSNLYRRAELFPSMTAVQDSVRRVETNRNGRKLPTLLIADDEPDMLRFIKSQLASEYNVLEAVDGQQAVDKAGQFLPDIILLDMMMPEKDGLQACREIRQRTSTQSIPVVLLTARADEEIKLAALEAGASDFLTKPFSTTELHVRIKNLVDSHQYQMKLAKQNTVLENTIDQLKETESQLVQTEKLASLGRMSAGIIHEINNPLNFATTGLFTLRNKGKHLAPEQQADYQEVLKDVEDGIKRVKNIVCDLRIFTHPDQDGRDNIALAGVVTSALRFLSGEWRDKVEIEVAIADQLTVWANQSKMIQVVTNMIQNSLDALKDKTFVDEKPKISIHGLIEDNRGILKIRDNGPGIDSAHVDKIFDPFFTTKDVGQGMGLGLSICYRIMQECDGRILVNTEKGQFCEFTLDFPLQPAASEETEGGGVHASQATAAA
jgi:signal transduction histidine kinase